MTMLTGGSHDVRRALNSSTHRWAEGSRRASFQPGVAALEREGLAAESASRNPLLRTWPIVLWYATNPGERKRPAIPAREETKALLGWFLQAGFQVSGLEQGCFGVAASGWREGERLARRIRQYRLSFEEMGRECAAAFIEAHPGLNADAGYREGQVWIKFAYAGRSGCTNRMLLLEMRCFEGPAAYTLKEIPRFTVQVKGHTILMGNLYDAADAAACAVILRDQCGPLIERYAEHAAAFDWPKWADYESMAVGL